MGIEQRDGSSEKRAGCVQHFGQHGFDVIEIIGVSGL
jgi:hypothetical protein